MTRHKFWEGLRLCQDCLAVSISAVSEFRALGGNHECVCGGETCACAYCTDTIALLVVRGGNVRELASGWTPITGVRTLH